MLILQERPSLLNLQVLMLSKDFDTSLVGRYVIVHLTNNRSFICKIWTKSFLHSDFCVLDPSVEITLHSQLPTSLAQNIQDQHLNRNNIEVIPKISIVKSLNLFIVFRDPWERLKWADRETALIDSLRELLKLFIISSNSVIHMNRFNEFNLFGIYSLNILSIGVSKFGRVVKSTKIRIDFKISLQTYDQLYRERIEEHIFHLSAYEDFKKILNYRSKIIGGNYLKNEIQKAGGGSILLFQQVLLIGAGGCGKSTLLQNVCFDNSIVMLPLDLSEIFTLNNEDKQAFFKHKIELACALSSEVKSGLCMILVKRIENMKSKSGKYLGLFNRFLEDVSREPNVIVVGTTDSPHLLDSSLRSANKFSIEIYLNIPSESERTMIFNKLCSKLNLNEKCCVCLAQNTPGFVLSDLVLIVRKSSKIILSTHLKKEVDIMNVISSCIKTTKPSSTRGVVGLVTASDSDINKLGGLNEIKGKLMQIVVWPILNSDSFKRMNIPSPSGVLLYGPPGCAKTSLVRAVASSCKTTFLSVSAADLYSPFVGDAEKTITQLFQRARSSAPTVLFIDEIDALVGSRTFREKGVQERILSSFLTELDGVGFKKDSENSLSEKYNPVVIIIAATNRPQIVDSALLRPGRFDKLIYVPPPDKTERLIILNKITQSLSIDSNLPLSRIADRTENYSGADLVNLCREAGLYAVTVCGIDVEQISEEHFDHALSNLKPSLNSEQIKWYSEFRFGCN